LGAGGPVASATDESIRDWVEHIAAVNAPADTLFWSGAAVSMAPPTCLPSGRALTERVLDELFGPEVLHELLAVYDDLELGRRLPRLEVVMGIASSERGHGDAAFGVLSDVLTAQPNHCHAYLADHIAAGGRHVTANFDTCIERAGAPDSVIHFHGSAEQPPAEWGATLANIEHGLEEPMREALRTTLEQSSLIVFAGYSGQDIFDIAPFFQQLAEGGEEPLRGKVVLWLCGPDDDRPGVEPYNPPEPTGGSAASDLAWADEPDWRELHWQWLLEAGASVWSAHSDLGGVLAEFARAWGMPDRPPTPGSSPTAPAACAAALDELAKQRCTLFLWEHAGVWRRACACVEAHPDLVDDQDRARIEAETAWHEGRYVDAATWWSRALTRGSIAWEERQAACLWVQGRLLRSYWRGARALSRSAGRGEDEARLAVTLGRTVVHMRRAPDVTVLGRLVTRGVLRQVNGFLRDRTVGIGLRKELESVSHQLGDPRRHGEQVQDARATYLETDALGALVNYRHGTLRSRLDPPNPAPSSEEASAEFGRQYAWAELIGAPGDAARIVLLPYAQRAFCRGCVKKELGRLQLSRWHRTRYLVADRLARMRDSRAIK
jgi:hypothetical protein